MNNTYQYMIYLLACGINNISPEKEKLKDLDVLELYSASVSHQLDALTGKTLQKTGIALPKEWSDGIAKAVRKTILFDAERAKLFSFMEQKGIWYLPLKGIVLKDFYPAIGMRQMSDNDILYDGDFCEDVQEYMVSQGYSARSVGLGHHDVYKKEPIYNFELHRSLYSKAHQEGWMEYYCNVKERLVLSAGTSYGYHFKDEDFYVHMVSHAYKHYTGSGTGLRTLLDFYVYLKVKEQTLDFDYIERECTTLECVEFERLNRKLCRKVFSEGIIESGETLWTELEKEEGELLEFYLTQGVYGTAKQGIESRIRKYQKKSGSKSKLRYFISRVFSKDSIYWHCPWAVKHKWLLPIACIWRAIRILLDKKHRNKFKREVEIAGNLSKD